MKIFDFFHNKKKETPLINNDSTSSQANDKLPIFPTDEKNISQIPASDVYCNKIYETYYQDYPKMPFISRHRELNTNWTEQAKMFPEQSIVPKTMMKRYSDGLLPGHIYMLYWLNKYSNKQIPAYFEYEYGINFKTEKEYLFTNGYLNEMNKPTAKGLKAIENHMEIIENSHPSPKYAGNFCIDSPTMSTVGRIIPSNLGVGNITIPLSDKNIIDKEFKQINIFVDFALKLAHLSENLYIDPVNFLYIGNFTFYEARPYTPTGKHSKYPLILHYAYASHDAPYPSQDYFGELYYLQDGSIGKARLIFWNNKNGYMIHLAMVNQKLSVKKVEKSSPANWETIYKL